MVNFNIPDTYVKNISFITLPEQFDQSITYTITSSQPSIATITNSNVLNSISAGISTITITQYNENIILTSTATLNVLNLPVNITADNKAITYGDSIPSLTYSINPNVTSINQLCNKEKITISINRQKVGFGINLPSGTKISDLSNINISRFDSGTSTNPYINIWVTNSDYTNYAVISISPSWTNTLANASYTTLQNEDIFIYETTGVVLAATVKYPTLTLGYQGLSWITSVSGVSGATAQLKLSDLSNLEIKEPPSTWFEPIGGLNINGTGSGAPRELSTNIAFGFNWMFGNINNNGDGTLADYIISNSTINEKYSFIPYTIRNANNGVAPTYSTTMIYSIDNINIGNNPISTIATIESNIENYDILLNITSFSSNYNLNFTNGTLNITRATLTVTGLSVISKVYDNTTVATVTGSSLNGVFTSDTQNVTIASQSGTFSNANVGTGKTVTVVITLSGTSAGNYIVSQPTGITGNITPVTLTVTNSSVISKVYDNTTVATVTGSNLNGLLTSDTQNVTIASQFGTFSNANVGTGKTVTVVITLSGTSAGNYIVSQPIDITGDITSAILTVTASSQSTTYGTLFLLDTTQFATSGLVNGDFVTSVTLIQGGNSTIPATQIAGSYTGNTNGILARAAQGTNLSNYTITYQSGTLTINPKSLTVTGLSVTSKVYDNTTAATVTGSILNGIFSSDTVTIDSQSGTFSDANVGTGKTVTVVITLSGTSAGNYIVSQPTGITGIITSATLTVTGSYVTPKIYNGTTVATVTGSNLNGIFSGDTVTIASQSGTFSDANVGTGKAVTLSIIISGSSAGNYIVSEPIGITGTITSASLTITAKSQSIIYGTSLLLVTDQFTTLGLANGDSVTSVTLTQGGNSTIPVNQNAGSYTGDINGILASSAQGTNLSNYTITYQSGTLTINPKSLTVISNSQSTTYGISLLLGTTQFTTSGLTNSDSVTSVILTQGGNSTILSTKNSGSYTGDTNGILSTAAQGNNLSNYTITYQSGTLTINKAILTVTANNLSKDYAAVVPILTSTITGYVNGENSSVISGTPSISTTCTQQSPVIQNGYSIIPTVGSLNASNYNFSFTNGKLTVNPITPVYKWLQTNTPPTTYMSSLTNLILYATATDIITGEPIGSFTYGAKNLTTGQIINNLTLNSILPSYGTYTLYATLTVTSPNYISTSSITLSKQLIVVQTYLNVKWYNPASIPSTIPLSSTQLNAICNSSTTGTYTPSSGTYLSTGNKQKLSVQFTTTDPGFIYNKIKANVKINIT